MARSETVPYVWASGADPADVVEPTQVKQEAGWVAEKPPFQYDNWFYNMVSGLLQNMEQNGIAEWATVTTYTAGALTLGSDGTLYQSAQAANTGNDPVGDGGTWWNEFTGGSTTATNGLSWPSADNTKTTNYTILVADDTERFIYTGTGGHTFTLDTGCKVAGFTAYVANAGTLGVKINDGTDDRITVWPTDMTYKITWDAGRNIFDISEV